MVLALASSTAAARPLSIEGEKSDNTMTFVYDAVTGRITDAASSRTLSRQDPLQFFTYVKDHPDAEVGKRLEAVVKLRLLKERAVELKGTLAVEIQSDAGATVETLEKEIDVVLRDRKGRRAKQFAWRFDLPTGSYTALGSFKK